MMIPKSLEFYDSELGIFTYFLWLLNDFFNIYFYQFLTNFNELFRSIFQKLISIKDNDSLAAMLAAEIQADLLILMSDVNGIYTKAPWEEGAKMIWTYTSEMRDTVQFGQKSKVGTGGMDSKVSNK